MIKIKIYGAGLAGCEAALYLADNGIYTELYEQKPVKYSEAHKSDLLAELVCSNSLKADRLASASGLLKAEMQLLGDKLLDIAYDSRVAAGGALAVERGEFSAKITKRVCENPFITLIRKEAEAFDEDCITLVATGPLTSGALANKITTLTGEESLAFFDAAAPIITAESIDMQKVFAASRYGRGGNDYLNCPFDKDSYEAFYAELVGAQSATLHSFDTEPEVYEGCMPIEIMAKRGADTMRYGPLRPVGIINPATGHRPWANIQLRSENKENTLYNIVGFQTNLKFAEQKRVFSMITGLEDAEFVRYGVMHRNTFLNAPKVLNKDLSLKNNPNIYFAGQITGFEGYVESMASGLLAARFILSRIQNKPVIDYPKDCMIGALLNYIGTQNKDFQPMGANMGLLPPCETRIKDKKLRYEQVAQKAVDALKTALGIN